MTAMLQLYGRYDPAGHCWLASTQRGSATVQACLAIIREDKVPGLDGGQTYMVLTGAGRDGRLTALVEFGGTHGLRVVAHSPALTDDAIPDPGRVTLQRLGDMQWGWVADLPDEAGTASDYVIWLPQADKIVPVCRLPHTRDAGGYHASVSYSIDQSDQDADYYPLHLRVRGTNNGRPIKLQATARFNLARYTYQLSGELP